MSHKKSNDRLQAQRAMDRVKWEAAKEFGLEGEPVQAGRLLAPEEHLTGQEPLKASIDRLEEKIAGESARKTEANLKDRKHRGRGRDLGEP